MTAANPRRIPTRPFVLLLGITTISTGWVREQAVGVVAPPRISIGRGAHGVKERAANAGQMVYCGKL